uniref:Myosin IXA n=1 Tax=Monodelphis domestica TaxID=13616 RepID=A0A5F8GUI5_MONDO
MNVSDVGGRRRFEDNEHTLHIYPGTIAEGTIYCAVPARKNSTAAEVIDALINRLQLDKTKCYVLAEVKEFGGEEWILNPTDCPVQRMMMWPRMALENKLSGEDYRFLLREKNLDGSIHYGSLQSWLRVTEERRRMMERGFLPQPQQKDYDDLCSLPDLNEKTLLENLRNRFKQEKIYTYVGSILIVINPFKFLPIYNPKYVKMYDNHQLGKLEPHIYAVADVAYHAMLQRRKNQCIVISGESGSGKTQSTNFLIHHLTALSQKGFASGVEQIILGAGPVLEAFGNAKTAHNNNSSRFGKFIQVNYQETGTVRGAYVEKYLLEKSRLVYQEHNERNYHVFYYLLAGASEEERAAFHLKQPEEYHYLNQQDCSIVDGEDLKHDFERLQLAMEMVGFLPKTRRQIFSLLSAILHLGNICYKKKTYRDESIDICNPEVLPIVSELLEVKEEMLFEALVTRKTVTVGEKLILPYKQAEAITVRNSMAKSLYSALFDWIVFRINHALLNTKDLEESTKTLSIGVLDIFGFEDYESNSFEQFCINFANERLQHYFNQHIFKLEQEEYRTEGISWHNIDYIDNSGCINLISKKPTGLLHLLDEESNFPQATNQTLLDKFKRQHEGNSYIEFPAVMEPAFIIKHYAGKVKYGVKDFREKNTDHMRPDIVALLRSSKNAFICGMIGIDPVAVFRWAILRAFFRALIAFREAGKRYIQKKIGNASFLFSPHHKHDLHIFQTLVFFDHLAIRDPVHFYNQKRNLIIYIKHDIKSPFFPTFFFLCVSQHLLEVNSLKHLTNLTLQDRITKSLLHLHKKKKPPSISAQFQVSLNKLMETLGQAEPYFVKCIRSNAEKLPLRFSDPLVLRQLRYTGMLETVRIRQSGYSCKYSFQDFVDHFHVLLQRDTIPSKFNIQDFFRKIKLSPKNYQVGKTMVFLKEQERQHLQDLLHQEVLQRIILLQRWFRAMLSRQHFLHLRQMRTAASIIQETWREHCRRRHAAATCIQAGWRGYWKSKLYKEQRNKIILLQAACRGFRARQRFRALKEQRLKETKLKNGLAIKENTLEIRGSDPSKWEDGSFEERMKAVEEYRFVVENNRIGHANSVDISEDLPCKQQERAISQSSVDLEQDVIVRQRRKSLEDLNQKKVGRAKRESRRMRELEQAIFSLKLLKVRGGISPSEERRWSTELISEGLRSSQGSPESESSQESLELLSFEENPKNKPDSVFSNEEDIHIPSPKVQKGLPHDPSFDLQENTPIVADENSNIFIRKRTPSNSEFSESVARKDRKDCDSQTITYKPQFRETFISNSLPTFYIPPQNPTKVSPEFGTGNEYKATNMLNFILFAILFWITEIGPHDPTPPRSPDLSGNCKKEFKENKDPSPKAKRKRSVKISNVALESVQWQNDSVQIITRASDLKSMDEFLLKKDSKKDTLVDVVFKKALKEFRQNIFSFYSSALAVSDSSLKHNGHIFKATQYSIPTYCEYCSSLIWIMDRASVLCKYACHKKCCLKTTAKCSKKVGKLSSRQFGVELSRLTSEERTVPLVVEKLINYIEMHGLYTEGIYRKSGSTNKIKELRQGLDTDLDSVNLDDYNIHVIASVFKQWLRDLPNPLMTFELYEEFLRAMGLQERKETIHGVYSVIDHDMIRQITLVGVLFSLWSSGWSVFFFRIALQEETNRMSANALAIVFAPCILRCPDTTDPLQSVQDISKTTTKVSKEQGLPLRTKMSCSHLAIEREKEVMLEEHGKNNGDTSVFRKHFETLRIHLYFLIFLGLLACPLPPPP